VGGASGRTASSGSYGVLVSVQATNDCKRTAPTMRTIEGVRGDMAVAKNETAHPRGAFEGHGRKSSQARFAGREPRRCSQTSMILDLTCHPKYEPAQTVAMQRVRKRDQLPREGGRAHTLRCYARSNGPFGSRYGSPPARCGAYELGRAPSCCRGTRKNHRTARCDLLARTPAVRSREAPPHTGRMKRRGVGVLLVEFSRREESLELSVRAWRRATSCPRSRRLGSGLRLRCRGLL
jgi:hypothetical protein